MKIEINFKNKKYTFKTRSKKIYVKDLINYFKQMLNFSEEDKIYIFNDKKFFKIDEHLSEENQKEELFITHCNMPEISIKDQYNDLKRKDMEELIMEATGADKPLQKKANNLFSRFSSRRNNFLANYANDPINILSRYGLGSLNQDIDDEMSDEFRLDSESEIINNNIIHNSNLIKKYQVVAIFVNK